jgi:uncharacterized cupin superfamily protein
MNNIIVEHNPSTAKLDVMNVDSWSIWTKEVSEFKWFYDRTETCYILEGEVIVTPDDGEAVTLSEGDLVTFPAGMSCTWNIKRDIKKHYKFD